ncbi:unnamed protein product [Danaus chrysippus]|uniref:(African queen) hypothetical protein n=1 Tax=Danaus chrysippus TaxID=151541 RepID=A0A8J2R7I0_9NEOP|nr:unnamed protein product [Danaus chrysippus]
MADSDVFNATIDIANVQQSELSNCSSLFKFSPTLLTFAAIVTGIIMVIGLFGNLLTVVALLKCPKVRNVAAAFIISLCIADFLFCAMVLPFAISGFWTRTWSHGGALCKLVPFLRYGNVGVSLLSIALITLNRYIMIAHHSWYGRVYRKHNIALMIIFSWMFSYGMQIPTLIGIWGKFDYDPELGTCSIVSDEFGRSAKTALFVIAFIVPALLIFICYARIFWVVHSSEQRMREHQRSQNTNAGSLNHDKRSTIKDTRETKARRNEWRITKMVLAIFLSFLVCYLPITIAKVADSHVHFPVFHIAGYLLLYASACVNPIIYVIMNAQYRAAYKAALCCSLPSPSSEKWKERHGYSFSNTRTVLSQVSLGESRADHRGSMTSGR